MKLMAAKGLAPLPAPFMPGVYPYRLLTHCNESGNIFLQMGKRA